MKYIIIPILVLFTVTSCRGDSFRIVNHEKPDLSVDYSPFINSGCQVDGQENGYRYYDCEKQSPLHKLGCFSIAVNELLGGLTPKYPTVKCGYFFPEHEENVTVPPNACISSFITISGVVCKRILVYKDSQYLILKNMEEFRAFFAPVDSPEEALSFALTNNEYSANYGQIRQPNYIYDVQKLEDTYVETVADGYLVHVFYTPILGCGPFRTESVEVKVTKDGYIEETNRFPVYRDPSIDSLCVD